MTFADKLSRLRRDSNHTQEQLAGILGVSRQAISKWESGLAFPETEKLIRISQIYDCSLDYLLKDDMTSEEEKGVESDQTEEKPLFTLRIRGLRERKSQRTLWGMPLYHVGKKATGVFAFGLDAKGIIAIGLRARGVVTLGMLSVGVFSFGLLALGLLAAGSLALGILSAGAISVGVISAGAISIGLFAVGALAVGDFSVGALAIGKYAALGDNARAMVALGDTEAEGTLFRRLGELSPDDAERVREILDTHVPAWLGWAKNMFLRIIG